jgi:hypothetical protein
MNQYKTKQKQSVQLSPKFFVVRPARLPPPAELAAAAATVAGRFLPRLRSDKPFLHLSLRNASFGFLALDRLRG